MSHSQRGASNASRGASQKTSTSRQTRSAGTQQHEQPNTSTPRLPTFGNLAASNDNLALPFMHSTESSLQMPFFPNNGQDSAVQAAWNTLINSGVDFSQIRPLLPSNRTIMQPDSDGSSIFHGSSSPGPFPQPSSPLVQEAQQTDDDDAAIFDDDDGEQPPNFDPEQAPLIRASRKRPQVELSHSESQPIPTARPTQKRRTQPSSSAQTTAAPTTPPRTTVAGQVAQPVTPYVNVPNPGKSSKPRENLQSPATAEIIKIAKLKYRAWVVTNCGFATLSARQEQAQQIVVNVCQTAKKGDSRALRFKEDPLYRQVVTNIIVNCTSQVRGELVQAFRNMVGVGFDLLRWPQEDVKSLVAGLFKTVVTGVELHNSYHFRQLTRQERPSGEAPGPIITRQGPYRSKMLVDAIRAQYFAEHERMATNADSNAEFNPMPLPTIALAATAMEVALREWQTGIHCKGTIKFSHDEYSGIYEAHLAELNRMAATHPGDMLRWRRSMYADCRRGVAPKGSSKAADAIAIPASEMGDFSDVV